MLLLCNVSRYHSYINTAIGILKEYNGGEPFPLYLKKFFSLHKKAGSKDRKQIAQLCYAYFRTGYLLGRSADEAILLKAVFLCSSQPDPLLENLQPELNSRTGLSVAEKFEWLNIQQPVEALFPWHTELSDTVNPANFAASLLSQPDVFIRVRPGKIKGIKEKLIREQLPFREPATDCIAFPPAVKLDTLFTPDRDAVIQDFSSQRVGDFFRELPVPESPAVWDACAASGGKSIMATDILGPLQLTVSDIRFSILRNLEKRFQVAGIKDYRLLEADLSVNDPLPEAESFDMVIADVPCSGSGTWGRNPEQLYYYDPAKTATYSRLQQQIVSALVPHIRKGGWLLYITCSVFRQENENNITFITERFPELQVEKQQLIDGTSARADFMFACLLRKKL